MNECTGAFAKTSCPSYPAGSVLCSQGEARVTSSNPRPPLVLRYHARYLAHQTKDGDENDSRMALALLLTVTSSQAQNIRNATNASSIFSIELLQFLSSIRSWECSNLLQRIRPRRAVILLVGYACSRTGFRVRCVAG
jgi:hypothetical protein